MPELTTWQGKDIEKMSREELLDVVREMGNLLQRAEHSLRNPPRKRAKEFIAKHFTGLP